MTSDTMEGGNLFPSMVFGCFLLTATRVLTNMVTILKELNKYIK